MFNYRTNEELEDIGRKFLRKLGIENQVRPDLMTIFTKLKHVDSKFNYCRVPDEKLPHAEAHWYSEDNVLTLRESVFVNMQRDDPRCRFTVAHEISHYLLGHKGFLNRATGQIQKDISSVLVKHQESEANRMAPILLAPEHLIPEGATVQTIQGKFGLSFEAANLRKDEVEEIRRRRRGETRTLPASIVELLKKARSEGMPIKTQLDD